MHYPKNELFPKKMINSRIRYTLFSIWFPLLFQIASQAIGQSHSDNAGVSPLVNSLGDTVITGKTLAIQGETIKTDEVSNPKSLLLTKPVRKKIETNIITIESPQIQKIIIAPEEKILVEPPLSGDLILDTTVLDWAKEVPAAEPRSKDQATKNIRYLDMEQGMASSYVWSVIRDRDSFLWFGTYGSGVTRYDGKTFLHFGTEQGLISDFVNVLIQDSEGRIWVGTDKGLNVFDGDRLHFFNDQAILGTQPIWSLFEDSKGFIWVGTEGGIFRIEDYSTYFQYSIDHGLPHNVIWSITEDHTGNIWLGTDGGLSKYSKEGPIESFTNYTKDQGLVIEHIWTLTEDKNGNLWMGTNGFGLIKLNKDRNLFTNYNTNNGLPNDWIWNVYEDKEGNMWFGSYGNGVFKYPVTNLNSEQFIIYNEKEGVSFDFVTSILDDETGKIWMGTDGGGVSVLDETKGLISHVTKNFGINRSFVYDILQDNDGNMWLSTSGGINQFKEDQSGSTRTVSLLGEEQGMSSDIVWSMIQDSQGSFWFGTGYGLHKFDPDLGEYGSMTIFTEENGIVDDYAWKLFEDNKNNLWIGTQGGGLSRKEFESGDFVNHTENTGYPSNTVMTIMEDSYENIWVGTYGGGLVRHTFHPNGESIRVISENEGLAGNIVTTVYEDSKNHLWIGTEGRGLSVLKSGNNGDYEIENFDMESGLSNNYVWSIIEDDIGRIWVGTENGLNVIIPGTSGDGLGRSNTWITVFDTRDGLRAADFYVEVLKDMEGNFWWSTGKSVVVIDPLMYDPDFEPPKTYLHSIEIGKDFVDFRKYNGLGKSPEEESLKGVEFSGVAPFFNYPTGLELPYSASQLSIKFGCIDWSGPSKIRYQYWLQGFDDDWSNPTEQRLATYSNLSHGEYTFNVRAISDEGMVGDAVSYSFMINTPWWLTWWAYLIDSILIVLVVMGIVRWRTYRINRHREHLKRQVNDRTKELQKSKEDLEASLKEIVNTQNQLLLSEKMASIGMLSSGIAHELSNPINAIFNGSKILKRDLSDVLKLMDYFEEVFNEKGNKEVLDFIKRYKESIEYDDLVNDIRVNLKTINLGATQTTNIIKSLSTYSRLDQENKVVGDIHQGLDNTLLLLENKLKYSIEIHKNYDKSIPEYNCYYGQLNQVFMNLISNAIDAINERGGSGDLYISTSYTSDTITITIRDTGIGIDPEKINKIFDPFYTSKDIGKGTGLGLSISQSIIEKHKGSITAESVPYEGTTFKIFLPIDEDQDFSESLTEKASIE